MIQELTKECPKCGAIMREAGHNGQELLLRCPMCHHVEMIDRGEDVSHKERPKPRFLRPDEFHTM